MNFLSFAKTLADKAGNIAQLYFRQPIETTVKSGGSPVTEADLAIETALRSMIRDAFPTHGILGEELGTTSADSEYLWVIDPIDGTTSFACGKPTFCTLIALLHNDKPILGIIDQPITGDRWIGIEGQPTTWNGSVCKTRFNAEALRFNCTTPAMFKTNEERDVFEWYQNQASVISFGGDAYAYGLLAGGCIDIILEADLQFYDIAALIPIIQGAGGMISDWKRRPLSRKDFQGRVLTIANGTWDAYYLG